MRVWLVSLVLVVAGTGCVAAPEADVARSSGPVTLGDQPTPRFTCHEFDDLSTPLAFHRSVADYVECARRVWEVPLRAVGVEAPQPKVFTVGVEEGGACATDLPEYAAGLFCPTDGSLVFSEDLVDLAALSALTTPQVVFHEYAHAVQHELGVDLAELSEDAHRRAELQATCWSAMLLPSLNGIEVTDEFRLALSAEVGSSESGDHGTGELRATWALIGLDATSVGECDTFAAPQTTVS